MLCLVSISAMAWNNNDHFVWDGIDYLVTDAANFKVKSYKVVDESIIVDGTVTVPHKIKDPSDTNIEWTVTSVRFYEGGKLPASVTKLVISEGIETLESIWQSSGVKEIVFPSTLKNYNHADVYTIQKFTIPDSNPYFKFVYYDTEKDANAGFLESKDGKTIYYFVYPATDIYEDANKTVVVANDVVTINNNVFNNTPNILTIKLGSSVTTVKAGNSPSQLTAYEVEDGNPVFAAYDGVLYKKDTTDPTGESYLLNAFPRGKKGDFTVYEKCTKLSSECLGSTSINTIYLNKVKRVEYNAFRFSSVQRIVIGEDLEYFRNSQTNANFKTFEFQKDIDEGVEVADRANSTNHAVFNIVDGVLMSKDNKTLISMPSGMHNGEDYTVPAGVTRIEDYAFHYTYIKNFKSNAELTALGTGCFTYTQLETADFSASTNLANVGGLNSSSKLKSVTLSPGVETFGGLTGCSQLEEVHVPDGSKLRQINDQACNGLANLKKFVFDGTCIASELKIGGRAFSGTGIEEIVLPPNVTSIGTSAFAQCASLKTVTFQETATIKTIATGAFAESSITSIVIPESVTSIGKEAFRSCDKLETISVPKATTNIDPEAFKYCDSLTDFDVFKDNDKYSSVDGYLLSKDKKTLVIFPPGKANDRFTLLPPSITKIGNYAFYSCDRLKNVTIPNKVTEIGARAFGLCNNLNTITFLCDEMIAPAKIDQRPNFNSFDDSMFGNIDINVRASKYETYTAEETFYNKFKSIKPSFLVDGKNEYIAVSDQSVDLLDIKETAHTYVVPGTINDGTKDWTVSLMGDYACQSAPSSIKEIVMFNNVEYIGAKAFKQTSGQSIQNLFFVQKEPTKQLLSTTRFELTPADLGGDDQYKEFDDNMKIYVRKSAYETVLADWEAYSSMIDYKIKDAPVSAKYGTFSREFDVDLAECVAEGGKKVYAFTGALTGIVSGGGDYGESEYHISMKSINCDAAGDGTYIPKNTGVLLKVMDADATDDNTFYTISDRNDDNLPGYAGDNVMKGVTVDAQSISTAGKSIYVMQKGLFRYVNPSSTPSLNMPIHKAYLELPVPAGAKVSFLFDDGDATTIDAINAADASSAPIYNIAGQRVNSRYNGVVIKNGKKFMVK